MSPKESILRWFRRGVTALFEQGLFASSGLVVSILLAWWFPVEEYGAYALAFSIYLFLSTLHNAVLLEPMTVLGPASYRNSLPEYLGRLIRLHFAVTIILGLIVGIGGSIFGLFSRNTVLPSALWGVCVGTPYMLFFWLWRRAAYLDLRPGVALRGAAVNTSANIALLFLFHVLGWLNPFTAFLVQAIAGIAASLMLIVSVRPRLRLPSVDDAMRTILKQHWEYGRWVVVTAFVFWVAGDAYYVILASTAGMTDVAILRAIQNLVRPVSQFILAITLLLVPWASARFADGEKQTFQRAINRVTLVFSGAALTYVLGLAVFGKWLTNLVYGGKYTQSAYLLPLVAMPVLFTAAAEGPSIAVRAMQMPSELLWAYSAAAVPTILFGVVLSRHWGITGGALGLGISACVYCATLTYRYKIRLGENFPAIAATTSGVEPDNVFGNRSEAGITSSKIGTPPSRRAVASISIAFEPLVASGMSRPRDTRSSRSTDKLRIVTSSWDDGHRADLRVAQLLRPRGMTGTFYVPVAPDGQDSLTHSDLRLLSSQGFEIGAHGYSHRLLRNLSSTDLAAQIEPCKPALEDIVGQEVRMFCYPQGRYDVNAMHALKEAGYSGARTVRMFSTGLQFDPFEMPTTVQAYPHSRFDYLRNVLRGGQLDSVQTCLSHSSRLSNWVDLSKRLFDSVLERGGVWHIYGHSWELDQLDLWRNLEELLDYVSNREGVMYVSNVKLAQVLTEGKPLLVEAVKS